MARRKIDLERMTVVGVSGVQPTDLRRTSSESRHVMTGVLESRKHMKEMSMSKAVTGATVVDYFMQSTTQANDYLVNVNSLATGDPELRSYIRIKELPVKMDSMSPSFEDDNGGPKSAGVDGKMIISPNSVQPLIGDHFLMDFSGKLCLFIVSEVTPLSMDSETAYEVGFTIAASDFVYAGSTLESCVIEEYVFESEHIGTGYRTMFRRREYDDVAALRVLYNDLGEIYLRDFYDKELNTFLLTVEDHGSPATLEVNVAVGNTVKKSRMEVGEERRGTASLRPYVGRELYDAELTEFILRNKIFDDIYGRTVFPTTYVSTTRPSSYHDTLFYALEKREKRCFKSRFLLPIETSAASPFAQATMFGKVNVIHVNTRSTTTLDLFPRDLWETVHMYEGGATIDATGNIWRGVIELIGAHVNGNDTPSLAFLSAVCGHPDGLQEYRSLMEKHEAFYLFPILGFLTRCCLERLLSKQDGNRFKDPVVHAPA